MDDDDLREEYYEEIQFERERWRLERDNEACGYIPPEEDEDND